MQSYQKRESFMTSNSRLSRMKKRSVMELHEHFEEENNAEVGVMKLSLKEKETSALRSLQRFD